MYGGGGDFESGRVRRLVPVENERRLEAILPVEKPFAHYSSHGNSADPSDHTPRPDPRDCHDEDEPARIRSNVKYPGIFATNLVSFACDDTYGCRQ